MKLLYLTLHKRQRILNIVLTLLLFLSLVSIQISIAVFMKSISFAQNISDRNIPQSQVISATPHVYDNLDEHLSTTKDPFTYEKTFVYPYTAYPGGVFNTFGEVYLEGYVKSDDEYAVIEGKKPAELKGNEIAIMDSYANELRNKGIEPINHEVEIYANLEAPIHFKIVSIISYTNFEASYRGKGITNDTNLFNISRSAPAIANFESVKNLCTQYGENTYTPIGSYMAKVHFKEYSKEAEKNLRQDFYWTYDNTGRTDFRLLIDEMNTTKTNDGIFQFVSFTVCIVFSLSCIFILYSVIKRKLMEDKEKLTILIANGIQKRNIQKVYRKEVLYLFAGASVLLVTFDVVSQIVLKYQSDYVLETLFTLSKTVGLASFLSIVIFFVLILVMLYLQVRSYFKSNIIRSLREKNIQVNVHSQRITHKTWAFTMALRDLISRPFSSIRNIVSMAMITLGMLLMVTTNSILTHLYSPETFGLQFDYVLANEIEFDNFKKLNDKYIDDFAFLDFKTGGGISQSFMVNNLSTRDENIFDYYPGIKFVITGELKNFLPLREGIYPPPPEDALGGNQYFEHATLVPRRIQHDFNLYYENAPELKENKKLITRTYVEYSGGRNINGFPIYGYTESIINNGYISFSNIAKSPLEKEYYPRVPSMILNLKDKADKVGFEKELEKYHVNYVKYDDTLQSLQKGNDEINSQLFFVMTCVGILSVLLFSIALYANVKTDITEKEAEDLCMAKIGIAKNLRYRRLLIQQLMMISISLLLAIGLYTIVQFPYFNILGIYLGLYELPSINWVIFIGYTLLLVIIVLAIIVGSFLKNKPKKLS